MRESDQLEDLEKFLTGGQDAAAAAAAGGARTDDAGCMEQQQQEAIVHGGHPSQPGGPGHWPQFEPENKRER